MYGRPSPNKAPPVFLLEGSTEIIAKFLFLKSCKKRLTNSSTKDDFPAPPVPVIPKTGILNFSTLVLISLRISKLLSPKFSADEISLPISR